MTSLEEIRGFWRYARGLREYLSRTLTAPEARALIARNLACRQDRFLAILEGAVFADPRSPYRRLFGAAGIALGDAARIVRSDGIEDALRRFHEAGVRLSLAEAKGKEAVRRGSLEFFVRAGDLQNRLASRDFRGVTGGSRSSGASFWIDLRDVVETAAYPALARRAFGLEHAAATMWLPAPPGVAGIRRALWWSKAGTPIRRWFAQSVPRWRPGEIRRAAFVRFTIASSRRADRPLPPPEPAPLEAAAGGVAHWLARSVRDGDPPLVFSTPSSGVRISAAAAESGLDLTGTFFAFGGEPYTETKARRLAAAGCRAESTYYVSELGGPVAVGCANPTGVDEAHLAEDRVALIAVPRSVGSRRSVPAFHVTALSPLVSRVAINLETGDYATEGRARCGCVYSELGLSRTLHTIRSYEKLSTEGMHFVGAELTTLLEDVLPGRFGGGPTDYQLVEQEDEDGRSSINLVVSPGIGPLDERSVASAALAFLSSRGAAESMMAEIWRGGGTFRVIRREPEVSRAGKVLPLHVARRATTTHGPSKTVPGTVSRG